MASLLSMPAIAIDQVELADFGSVWKANGGRLSRTPPFSSGSLGKIFDTAVASALAIMLGNIPVVVPSSSALIPANANCVELGPVRVVGGVRPQNFDVGYRPDGVRFAFDSKTLNDADSVGKNWQNMVNDLATEATTVHTRFPHAVAAFMVVIPRPCIGGATLKALVETLERLGRRTGIDGPHHMAEAMSLVLWNPDDGALDADIPAPSSSIRIERFSEAVESTYWNRYKGLPPHAGE